MSARAPSSGSDGARGWSSASSGGGASRTSASSRRWSASHARSSSRRRSPTAPTTMPPFRSARGRRSRSRSSSQRCASCSPFDGTEHVLDVGTGSGYAAAVLDELAASVVSIERVERARGARAAGARARRVTATSRCGSADGTLGAPDRAPFEAISIAAATTAFPPALFEQLADGGRMVLPRGGPGGQRLVRVVRTPSGPVETASLACRFVPLVAE